MAVEMEFISVDTLANAALVVVKSEVDLSMEERKEIMMALDQAAQIAKAAGRTVNLSGTILFFNGEIQCLTLQERKDLLAVLQEVKE